LKRSLRGGDQLESSEPLGRIFEHGLQRSRVSANPSLSLRALGIHFAHPFVTLVGTQRLRISARYCLSRHPFMRSCFELRALHIVTTILFVAITQTRCDAAQAVLL
jgi:hypothetical protein